MRETFNSMGISYLSEFQPARMTSFDSERARTSLKKW